MQRIPKSLLFSALTICILSLSGCGPLIGKKSVTIGMMKEIGDTYEKSTLGGLGMTLVSPILLPVGLAMDITGLGEKDLVTVASVAGAAYVASKSGKNTPYTGYSNYGNSSSSDSNYSSGGSSSKSYSSSSSSSGRSSSGSRYSKSYSSSSVRKESKPLYGGKKTRYTVNHCAPTMLFKGGITVGDVVKNTCPFDITVVDACQGQTRGKIYPPKADYPFKGVYNIIGSGTYDIKTFGDAIDPDRDLCQKDGGHRVRIVCEKGYQPYFTSAEASEHKAICIEF